MPFLFVTLYFMFAVSSVNVKLVLYNAISNFKLRFVPRELWNVVVDTLVRFFVAIPENYFPLFAIAN